MSDSIALRLLAPADAGRRALMRLAGRVGLAKSVLIDRERRVALGVLLTVLSSLTLAVALPLHLLAIGPLLLGVPHLVADVRYLVLPTGLQRQLGALLSIGVPLILVVATGDIRWGMVAVLGAALHAPPAPGAPVGRRVAAVALALALLYVAHRARFATTFVLAHLHNLIAIAWLVLLGRGAPRGWTWAALAAFALGAALIGLGVFDAVPWRLGSFDVLPSATSIDEQIFSLAPPGARGQEAVRWVVLFAFAQSVHYGLWLRVIPDRARPSHTSRSFSQSARVLARQLGLPALLVAFGVAVGLVGYAAHEPHAARLLYFRLALFHGYLELAAFAALIVSGRALFAQPH